MLSDHTESKDKFVMDSISFPPEAIVKILSYTDADDLTRLEEGASKQWTDLVKLAAREMAKRKAKRWAKEGFYPTEEDVRVLKQLMKLGTISGMCNQIIYLVSWSSLFHILFLLFYLTLSFHWLYPQLSLLKSGKYCSKALETKLKTYSRRG